MELAIGTMPTDEGIKVLCLDGDGKLEAHSVRLLADGGGLPKKKRDRMFFESSFETWRTATFEAYCEGLSATLPEGIEARHQVFVATTAEGIEVHIPAAALMHGLFRPGAKVLDAALSPVNLDLLAHIGVDNDLPVVHIRTGLDSFDRKSLNAGAGRYLKWLFSTASGRMCAQSGHLRALHGWLDLALPKGRARFGVHGARNGSNFYATEVTVHWVKVPADDNLSGQSELHFLHRSEPLAAAQELVAGMPAVLEAEWPALATVLPAEAEPELVDLMVARLQEGHWRRATEGRVAQAGQLLQSWHEKGVLKTMVNRLGSMRSGTLKIDDEKARRLRALSDLTTTERQMTMKARAGAMDVFLDTEYATDAGGQVQLLSIGMCTSAGHEFYGEVAHTAAPIGAGQFLEEHVFPQLGHGLGMRGSFIEVAGGMARWLSSLGADLNVCYDFSLDYQFIEQLLEMVPGELKAHLEPTHIGYLLEDEAGIRAAEASWAETAAARGMRRHHALADALALGARFRAVHPG